MAVTFINMLTHPPSHFPANNIISKIKEVNKKTGRLENYNLKHDMIN